MVFNKISELFAKIKDGSGNSITSTDLGSGKRGLDISGTLTPYDRSKTSSGTLTSISSTFVVALDGYQSCAFTLTGTWVAAIIIEASSDGGTTWAQSSFHKTAGEMEQLQIGVPELVQSVTANGIYKSNTIGGVTHLRLKPTSFTSGTVNIAALVSESQNMLKFTQSSIVQNVIVSVNNSSTANLAAGAQFVGAADTTLGVATIQVSFISDQKCKLQVQQSNDGIHWDIEDLISVPINTARGRNYAAIASYVRVIVTNQGGQATAYVRLQTCLCPIANTLPRALTDEGNLKVAVVEKNPHTQEGSIDKWHVQDIESRQLLEEILEELKTMNKYFEIMTDERINNYDITDSD